MKDENENPKAKYNNKVMSMPISNITFERILKLKNNESANLLYMEYCDLVLSNETTQIYATNEWVSKKIHMNVHKLIKAKKALIELGLIRNIRKRSKTGFGKCYIKVNFIFKPDYDVLCQNVHSTEIVQQKRTLPITTLYKTTDILNTNYNNTKQQTDNFNNKNNPPTPKIIRKRRLVVSNNEQTLLDQIKELTKQNESLKNKLDQFLPKSKKEPNQLELFPKDELVSEKHFEPFWKLYPRPEDKGSARVAFRKMCTQKNKQSVRPTWNFLRDRLIGHTNSERWKDPTFRIPNPATWINNERWDNDPKDMEKLNFDKPYTKPTNGAKYPGIMGQEIDYEADQKEFLENKKESRRLGITTVAQNSRIKYNTQIR